MSASPSPLPTMESQSLTLADGRRLGYAQYGDPAGAPLIYFHGGGSSRLEPRYADRYARRLGLRLIGMDRPGYGLSTPMAEVNWQGVGRDALALADALSLKRFGVVGMSAGAPYALHLAAAAPERVTQVVLINPSAETVHPAWRAVPRRLRLLIAVSSFRPLLRLSARALRRNPARISQRIACSQNWTAEQQQDFIAAVSEGLREPWSLDTLCAEAQRVLHTPWQLDWNAVRQPVLAICGVDDPAHEFYRALAQRHPQIHFTPIPGPHMPIVPETNWELIGRSLVCRLR